MADDTRVFRVWAPAAQCVEVELRTGRHGMGRQDSGWWEAELPARAGDAYLFVLDGAPLPDPRSLEQPAGVRGPSRVVDHAGFAWTDSEWRGFGLTEAVIYELHIGTFTAEGTFTAAIEHLDHLVSLGVNAVEIMPVAEFAGARDWGYDGVDLFAPHHAYGGPDGLKSLVDACHGRGLAVVMDVVYNHIGPEGSDLAAWGPYVAQHVFTPWGPAFNYDAAGSDEVRAFVLDNAVMWLRDYHCDGLRLDAVHAIIDTSAVHILEAIARRVAELSEELQRPLWVIAESDLNDPRVVRDREHGGYGLTAQWSDDFHHSLHALLTGESGGYYEDFQDLECTCVALRQAFVRPGEYRRWRGRSYGRPIGDVPLTRFLAYAQDHDMVGNRAVGERLSHLVGPERARMAAALTLLSPFVPMLFAGEEWAASTPFLYFTDFSASALQRAVDAGRRSMFATYGFNAASASDPQDADTFERCKLCWDEIYELEHTLMLRWYQDLIALRRATPALHSGDASHVSVRCDRDHRVLVYVNAGLIVACNLGTARVTIEDAEDAERLMSSAIGAGAELLPESVAVWRYATSDGQRVKPPKAEAAPPRDDAPSAEREPTSEMNDVAPTEISLPPDMHDVALDETLPPPAGDDVTPAEIQPTSDVGDITPTEPPLPDVDDATSAGLEPASEMNDVAATEISLPPDPDDAGSDGPPPPPTVDDIEPAGPPPPPVVEDSEPPEPPPPPAVDDIDPAEPPPPPGGESHR